MIITLIPLDEIDNVWRYAAPHILRATDRSHDRYALYDIFKAVKMGQQQLWMVYEEDKDVAAFTTSITPYPGRKILTCQFCGGSKLEEWASEATDILKNFAQDNDCTMIELYGRKGWVKELRKHGWEDEFSAYQLELGDG